MSLNISVGLLAGVDEEDEDVVQEELDFLQEVNEALREKGLAEHNEPLEIPEGFDYWNATVSNGALQELIDVAAKLAETEGHDAVEKFPHLVGAQCSYYLPVEMPEPLLFELEELDEDDEGEDYEEEYDDEDNEEDMDDGDEEGGEEDDEEVLIAVGSSIRLMQELEQVAASIDLPVTRFPIDYSGEGGDENWDKIFSDLQSQNSRCGECEDAARALVNLYQAFQISQQYKMAMCIG